MQVAIQSPNATPVRFAGGRLQIGISGVYYYSGYSIPLNWAKTGSWPVLENFGKEYNKTSVAEGYFTEQGEVVPGSILTGAGFLRYGFMTTTGNPGVDWTGEDFTAFYDGTVGTVLGLSITNIVHTPAQKKVTFKAANGSNWLRLGISDVNDPPKNIRIIQTRYLTDTVLDGITFKGWLNGGEFNPHWLHEIRRMGVFRCMDLLSTNWSEVVEFSDFSTDADLMWGHFDSRKNPKWGFSLDAIIRIANLIKVAPWINIPHQASNDCVLQLATKFKNGLDPKLVPCFEWSNEVWNDGFATGLSDPNERKRHQRTYARDKATATAGLQADNGNQYTGYRAAQCMKIISDVYANRSRWRGKLGTQSVSTPVTNAMITGFNVWNSQNGGATAISALFDDVSGTGYFGEIVGSHQILGLTRGVQTQIVLPFDTGQLYPVGTEIVVGLRRGMSGIPEISLAAPDTDGEVNVKYHTVVARGGSNNDTITINTDSSAMSPWINDAESYVANAKYFRLADESERLWRLGQRPTIDDYFNKQLAQLCTTGTCDFGITMSNSYTLDGFDTSPGHWNQQKAICDPLGLGFDQYEGGCHFITTTMMVGYPEENPVGDRFEKFRKASSHSVELGLVYTNMFRRLVKATGGMPSKFTDAGAKIWGGIWAFPHGPSNAHDLDNPVNKAVKAAACAYWAP